MIEETVVIVDRDAYSAITGVKGMSGDAVVMARSIIASFKYVLPKTFVEFDRAGRGDALNLELYG